MKIIFFTIICFLLFFKINIQAQSANIYTSGKYIIGTCGDTLNLKGINYAPYNWGYDSTSLNIDQVAKTGANVIRLPWYATPPTGTMYNNYVALDSVLSKCVQNKLIAIIVLLDFTCKNNASDLIAGAKWYSNPNVLPILLKYKKNLIINIANEALYYNWDSNPTSALLTYQNAYDTIISNLRSNPGFTFPLMIDAPDCGANTDAFIINNTAQNIINADPLHNVIFSGHSYWYAFANNDSTTMALKVNNILPKNIPLVFAEVANLQDDVTPCQYVLNYKPFLEFLTNNNVGWLAWSWDNDICTNRQLSTNGNFNSLTTFGQDIISNPIYGLQINTIKSVYLEKGNYCNAPLLLKNIDLYLNCTDNAIALNYSLNNLANYQLLASTDMKNWDNIETNIFKTSEGLIYFNKNEKYNYYKVIVNNGIINESNILFCSTNKESIYVSPNPASTEINITSNTKLISIEIYNQLGKRLQTISNINDLKCKINISYLQSGIYYLKAVDYKFNVQNSKFSILK